MPKLVQISAAFNCGAPGIIVEQIGEMAQSIGWDVAVVHGCRHFFPSKLKTLSKTTRLEEYRHAFKGILFDAHGLGSESHTKQVVQLLKVYKPDLIHLHNIHGYYIHFPVLFDYLKSAKIPVVWTFHDFWPITGHCVHFDYVGCGKWKDGCHDCSYHKSYPFSIVDKSCRNYQLKKQIFTGLENLTIVAVSDWVRSILKESFMGCYPIQRIYNGVDTSVFCPKESSFRETFNINNSDMVLLGVASPWSDMKGLKDYYQLSAVLPSSYRIVLVGLTEKQIKDLPKNIIGIQRVNSREELSEIYSSADVVMNLSYQETFGLTTVEGLSCGTPGIVYDRTASPELITPDVGLIVKAGNIKGLVEAVEKIKSNGKLFYADACRQRVLKEFDKVSCYQQYIDLYSRLISNKL